MEKTQWFQKAVQSVLDTDEEAAKKISISLPLTSLHRPYITHPESFQDWIQESEYIGDESGYPGVTTGRDS